MIGPFTSFSKRKTVLESAQMWLAGSINCAAHSTVILLQIFILIN